MGLALLGLFVVCACYVQVRGQVRHQRFRRRITDHSNLLAPINCLFYLFSAVPNRPYLSLATFPQLALLEAHWQTIRAEAEALEQHAQICASEQLDDLGFNSFFRTGWKRFYLKWYGADLRSAQATCPLTLELLQQLPMVKGAMFAMLPPGSKLVQHRDPYAGSLRYHLGLVTPNDDRCYLEVDGHRYSWRDGQAVLFDETFIHYAENQTDHNRIVLFLDVERPVRWRPIAWLNGLLSRTLLAATATKNVEGDKVGLLNRVFGHIYQVRRVGKRLKAFNQQFYYTAQYSLYLGLIYLIFLR